MANGDSFTRELITAAVTAPSGGNNQPWRFFADSEEIWVALDRTRLSSSTLDVGERASYAALGASVEAMVIAAARFGRRADATWLPRPDAPDVVARLRFHDASADDLASDAAFFDLLGARHTNRRASKREAIPPSDLEALREAAESRGAALHLVTAEDALANVAEVVGMSDVIRVFDNRLRSEMLSEMRFTPEEVERTRDGIDIATLEVSSVQRWLISKLGSPALVRVLQLIGFSRGLVAGTRKTMASSSAFGVITMPGTSVLDFLQGGRAMERVWLRATRLGFAFQPLSAIAYLFTRARQFDGAGLSSDMVARLGDLYSQFSKTFPDLPPGRADVLYFRLAHAGSATSRALRRPIEDVLTFGPPPV